MAAAFIAILQSATSSGLVYWFWTPVDERASVFGPFVNRNHFATWMIMALPLVAGYVVARRRGVGTRRSPGKRRIDTLRLFGDLRAVWLTAAAALMALGLVMSLSRSGLTSVVLTTGFGIAIVRQRFGHRTGVWLGIWAVLVVLVAASWANVDLFLQRLDAALVEPTGGRLPIWRDTFGVIREFWLTGAGLNAYPSAMLIYQQSNRIVFYNQAHNHYLQLAAEGGLLLGVPVALALVAFMRLAVRRLQLDSSWRYWLRAGAVVGLTAVSVQSLWEGGLRIPANALLAAVLAAIAVHEPHRGGHGQGGQEP